MWQFNVQSSVAASHVASKLLVEGGLLVLTGANAALNATPSMIAYHAFEFFFSFNISFKYNF